MSEHWVSLCLTREDYRRAWEKGVGPGQVKAPPETVKAEPSKPDIASREELAEAVFSRPVFLPEKKTVEERLELCLSCHGLEFHKDLGIYCGFHSPGCSGNWSIILVKNISGELQRKPCKPWIDAGLAIMAKEDRQAVYNWLTALPPVDPPPT